MPCCYCLLLSIFAYQIKGNKVFIWRKDGKRNVLSNQITKKLTENIFGRQQEEEKGLKCLLIQKRTHYALSKSIA